MFTPPFILRSTSAKSHYWVESQFPDILVLSMQWLVQQDSRGETPKQTGSSICIICYSVSETVRSQVLFVPLKTRCWSKKWSWRTCWTMWIWWSWSSKMFFWPTKSVGPIKYFGPNFFSFAKQNCLPKKFFSKQNSQPKTFSSRNKIVNQIYFLLTKIVFDQKILLTIIFSTKIFVKYWPQNKGGGDKYTTQDVCPSHTWGQTLMFSWSSPYLSKMSVLDHLL